ncbi:MAG: hypothetical protein GY839_02130, partial [candidate division Zixibacteria bacterium]|nr:hypothetical protein [candidate division Zixibacteria bacterium]
MSLIKLVTKIRYMMEYMTLCADPTLFELDSNTHRHPAPNGVPMGIVTLPDFVVDVAVDRVETFRPTSEDPFDPLDVGGRAGRLAWVLQEFGGQRNGWYNIKYVAKAGDVGRIVLERRFIKSNNEAGFEAITLRHIIPSNQDYDWI